MIRTLRHRQLVHQLFMISGNKVCRCLSTENDGKDGKSGGIKPMDTDNEITDSDPSLSLKLAKPTGRNLYQKDPKHRMPGLAPGQLNIDEVSQNIDERLQRLAKMVAKSFSEDPKDVRRTEAELEFMVKAAAIERESGATSEPIQMDMMKILRGFDIERPIPKRELKPVKFVQPLDKARRRERQYNEMDMDAEELPQHSLEGSISEAIIKEASQSRRPRREMRERRSESGQDADRRPPRGPPPAPRPLSGYSKRQRTSEAIFSHEPLGIFDVQPKGAADDVPDLCPTWSLLVEDELNMAATKPPRNAFEEMILWTKQGKLWHYPIDNEQGIEGEDKVPFYEHVFLDHLLKEFPDKGPIRQFMEVMLLGLSSNPYITVQRKHQTILWFKTYFDHKSALAKRVGAM